LLSRFRLINAKYDFKDSAVNFLTTIGAVLVSLVAATFLLAVYTFAYRFRIFTMSPTDWWAWALIFFGDDLAYYWFHRISHEMRFWWASHVNHHSSQHFNLSTALRQTWTSEIIGAAWLPYIPLALLGFPPWMIILEHSFNLFYQFWIHTESIKRMPRWFEAVMNTPSHHRVHHASNPRYLDRNYAGILIIWDKIFGTYAPEVDEEPVRYGIVHNLNTNNLFTVAFHEWVAIIKDLSTARSPREAFGVVFGPPGWKQGETSDHIRKAWADAQTQSA
jgi:sterol desaturase/sphingolipid hydroxylase (fatty acid hydroxylase superfamily)